MTELEKLLRETLAPRFETGVFARLGGGPRIVPARLAGADFGTGVGFVGMLVFEGVFARGGAGLEAAAYNSSRYSSSPLQPLEVPWRCVSASSLLEEVSLGLASRPSAHGA